MVPQSTGAQPPGPRATGLVDRVAGRAAGREDVGERGFRDWLAARLSEFLQRPVAEIDPRTPFAEYGLDSVAALSLYGDIEDEFELYLEPTVAWDHPTVEDLARYLAREYVKLGDGESGGEDTSEGRDDYRGDRESGGEGRAEDRAEDRGEDRGEGDSGSASDGRPEV
ncbi:acyl carrier protein [Streptomyces iconiensis]|uniref:acyl carrier protein n=1 Tax=Streptomyces iconiensis TaxID=1384038 RepID=UPI00321B78B4